MNSLADEAQTAPPQATRPPPLLAAFRPSVPIVIRPASPADLDAQVPSLMPRAARARIRAPAPPLTFADEPTPADTLLSRIIC